MLSSVGRTDGLQQVAAVRPPFDFELPLYFCALDQQPGDKKCADVVDQWGFWMAYRP
jgi:hypothetical protein